MSVTVLSPPVALCLPINSEVTSVTPSRCACPPAWADPHRRSWQGHETASPSRTIRMRRRVPWPGGRAAAESVLAVGLSRRHRSTARNAGPARRRAGWSPPAVGMRCGHRRDDAVGAAEQEISVAAQPSRAQFRGVTIGRQVVPLGGEPRPRGGVYAEARVEFGRIPSDRCRPGRAARQRVLAS